MLVNHYPLTKETTVRKFYSETICRSLAKKEYTIGFWKLKKTK